MDSSTVQLPGHPLEGEAERLAFGVERVPVTAGVEGWGSVRRARAHRGPGGAGPIQAPPQPAGLEPGADAPT